MSLSHWTNFSFVEMVNSKRQVNEITWSLGKNRPFHRYGGHIEYIKFKEYYEMPRPGGVRSVFTRAFRAKRDLQCIFLGKEAIIITSKHGTMIFFSHYNLFLGKL